MPALTCPRCQTSVTSDGATGTVVCERCGTGFDPHQQDTPVLTPSAAAPAGQLHPGQGIDGYRLRRRLGTGGMSEVWEVEHAGSRKPAALKILHARLAGDSGLRRRFQREVEALQHLRHPQIIAIRDHGLWLGRPYLVSELVGDHTIRQELNQQAGAGLGPQRVLDIADDVFAALAHAHARGLVHRDIKPENLIVDAEGNVHLADFGIAQVARGVDGSTLTQLTDAGVVLGTYAYMAPEQAEGDELDVRADLYSLGVVLYEALTGRRPVGRFSDPSEFLPEAEKPRAAAWNNFILSLLQHDRQARPADVEQAQALRAAIEAPVGALAPMLAGTDSTGQGGKSKEFNNLQKSKKSKNLKKSTSTMAAGEWPITGLGLAPPPIYLHSGLQRYRREGVFGGVCAGLGAWSGVGTGWWRLLVIILAVFTGPGVIVTLGAYVLMCVVVPACPDKFYLPRPLNAGLPARPPGWFFGVCALLGQRTGVPAWLWRVGFVPTLALGSWIVYLLAAALLPAQRQREEFSSHQLRSPPASAPGELAAEARGDLPGRRFWTGAALGLILLVVWPLALASETGLALSAGLERSLAQVDVLLAGLAGLALVLMGRQRVQTHPRVGLAGGLLLAAGILCMLGALLAGPGPAAEFAASLQSLGLFLAILIVAAATLAGNVHILPMAGATLLALLSTMALSQAVALPDAQAGVGWWITALSTPMAIWEHFQGRQALAPLQVMIAGLATWAAAAIACSGVAGLCGIDAEEAAPSPWRPAALLVALGLVAAMALLAVVVGVGPLLALQVLLVELPRLAEHDYSWFHYVLLVCLPVILILTLIPSRRGPKARASSALGLGLAVLLILAAAGWVIGERPESGGPVLVPQPMADGPSAISGARLLLQHRDGTKVPVSFGQTQASAANGDSFSFAYESRPSAARRNGTRPPGMHGLQRQLRSIQVIDAGGEVYRSELLRHGLHEAGEGSPPIGLASTGWHLRLLPED